jgi:hypothetical protein
MANANLVAGRTNGANKLVGQSIARLRPFDEVLLSPILHPPLTISYGQEALKGVTATKLLTGPTASAYSILAKTAARLSDNGRRTVAHHRGGKHLTSRIGSAALIPNPALKPFEVLVGEWQTTGSHPDLPDSTLHGRTSFDWLEGGAYLIMHSEIDDPNFPSGVAIFGSDDVAKKYSMLYFDERGISRKFEVTMAGNQLKWWRDEPSFSQRFTIAIEDDGNKMVGKGEMSREGAAWEKDLALTFVRLS